MFIVRKVLSSVFGEDLIIIIICVMFSTMLGTMIGQVIPCKIFDICNIIDKADIFKIECVCDSKNDNFCRCQVVPVNRKEFCINMKKE